MAIIKLLKFLSEYGVGDGYWWSILYFVLYIIGYPVFFPHNNVYETVEILWLAQ